MAQSEFLVAGKLEGSNENIVTLIVTADDLAQAKTALKNELWEDYEPTEMQLWNGMDDDRREVEITFAQALSDVRRLDAKEVGSLEHHLEDNEPVLF